MEPEYLMEQLRLIEKVKVQSMDGLKPEEMQQQPGHGLILQPD
ncbi:MAG: hypothetical protein ACYCVD_16460 [Desulfitobacteriaceae bacterium]